MDNTKISFLSSTKGKNVIKCDLQKGNEENARAILYLPVDSMVDEHSHKEDSEVYINILKIMQLINHDETLKGYSLKEVFKIIEDYGCPIHIRNWFQSLLASSIKVAGKNSPTGDLSHGIDKSRNPQIYLTIKKGLEEKNWDQFNNKKNKNYFTYFDNLDFDCLLRENELMMISGQEQKQEFVKIDTKNQIVEYKNHLIKPIKIQVNSKNQTLDNIINKENSINYQQNQTLEI